MIVLCIGVQPFFEAEDGANLGGRMVIRIEVSIAIGMCRLSEHPGVELFFSMSPYYKGVIHIPQPYSWFLGGRIDC